MIKRIYSHRTDLLDYLLKNDIIERFSSEMGTKWQVSIGELPQAQAGKLTTIVSLGQETNSPWIFANPGEDRDCLKNMSLHHKCGIIPSQCFDKCWKVCVKPTTVKELLLLHELQEDMITRYEDCWCKCGIEERKYVESSYGGYFYNDTLKKGIVRCQEVMKEVMEHVGEETGKLVYLKRGCTEMEIRFGDSRHWKWDESYKRWEDLYNEHFSVTQNKNILQPPFLRDHIVLRWLKRAADIGDKSAVFFNDGKPLYPSTHKYYQREAR